MFKSPMKLNWFLGICLVLLCGCATVAESGKLLMGISTKALEEAKENKGQSQTFKISYAECYQRVSDLLLKKKVHLFLHSQQKHRILALNFMNETDTTEVGIFFTELPNTETKVTVVSLSPTVQKIASEIIFPGLAQNPSESNKKEETK